MTEDYKEQLLNYVTGNLENTNPNYKDFDIVEQKINQYKDSLNDFFAELSQKALRLEITGILENEKYGVSILYGAYALQSNYGNLRGRGFLIYLDEDNNVLQVLFEDANGNPLRGFHKLYIDEDTNRIYGVLGHPTMPINNESNYLCYMNNLFLKNKNGQYECHIIKSYDLEENDLRVNQIVKDNDSASYLMIGTTTLGMTNIKVLQYTISVELEGELKKWNVVSDGTLGIYDYTYTSIISYYLWFRESVPHFKVIFGGLNYSGTTYNGKYYALAEDDEDNVLYTRLNEINNLITGSDSIWRNTSYYQLEVLGINENKIYFVVAYENIKNGTYYYQSKIQIFDGSSVKDIYSSNIETSPNTDIPNIEYYNLYQDIDSTIYITKYNVDTTNNLVYTSLNNLTKNQGNLDNTWVNLNSYPYEGENKIYTNFTISQRIYNINKIYNICGNISNLTFTQENLTGYILYIKNLHLINYYNGDTYISKEVLSPLYSNLYSNGSIVFSRNLYNISKQNNMMMASVEIPNNYLNDLTITQNDLISETNLQMNSDSTNWTKNIYEVVDVNFLNTILVKDVDLNKEYLLCATRINDSITDINDYSNATCNKVRINYADYTNKIFPISWEEIDSTHKQTEFSIYVDKSIKSIDFISNDTDTIYLTKDLDVEVGKYYTINQKIKIGE